MILDAFSNFLCSLMCMSPSERLSHRLRTTRLVQELVIQCLWRTHTCSNSWTISFARISIACHCFNTIAAVKVFSKFKVNALTVVCSSSSRSTSIPKEGSELLFEATRSNSIIFRILRRTSDDLISMWGTRLLCFTMEFSCIVVGGCNDGRSLRWKARLTPSQITLSGVGPHAGQIMSFSIASRLLYPNHAAIKTASGTKGSGDPYLMYRLCTTFTHAANGISDDVNDAV